MAEPRETAIAVVSPAPNRRIVVALREKAEKPIVLRIESFSPDVGWYVQQEMCLTRPELTGLKRVLGIQIPASCERMLDISDHADQSNSHILSFADAKRSRRA